MQNEIYLFDTKHIDNNLAEKSGIIFRPLSINDFEKWFCNVLWELTKCDTSQENFTKIFQKLYRINQKNLQYFIIVWEDQNTKKIVACGSVIIEQKFVHGWKNVWHIEDIVISGSQRGKWLWENLIQILKNIAKKTCYKVILDCDKKNLWFYKKCWFEEKNLWLSIYF